VALYWVSVTFNIKNKLHSENAVKPLYSNEMIHFGIEYLFVVSVFNSTTTFVFFKGTKVLRQMGFDIIT